MFTGNITFGASPVCWHSLDDVMFLQYTEGGSQKATLVVVVVVISSLKIPKAFLICSTAQRNFAYTFVLIFPIDTPPQIFHLFSN